MLKLRFTMHLVSHGEASAQVEARSGSGVSSVVREGVERAPAESNAGNDNEKEDPSTSTAQLSCSALTHSLQ
ncbi:uncharacterized protein V6R79_004767 [Siganus canaliculatus]